MGKITNFSLPRSKTQFLEFKDSCQLHARPQAQILFAMELSYPYLLACSNAFMISILTMWNCNCVLFPNQLQVQAALALGSDSVPGVKNRIRELSHCIEMNSGVVSLYGIRGQPSTLRIVSYNYSANHTSFLLNNPMNIWAKQTWCVEFVHFFNLPVREKKGKISQIYCLDWMGRNWNSLNLKLYKDICLALLH